MDHLNIFKEINLFSELSETQLSTLEEQCHIRKYKKNTIIVNKGDDTKSLYIIIEGKLDAYLDDEQGKEVILSKMEEGESFGELSLLSESSRSANVVTRTPCTLATISKPVFMDLIMQNPLIAYNIMQSLIQRIHTLTENVSGLALLDVYGRLVKILYKDAIEKDGKLTTERLTHQDIANMIGSSREMVSKILKDLKTGGYINLNGKSIIIEKTLPTHW